MNILYCIVFSFLLKLSILSISVCSKWWELLKLIKQKEFKFVTNNFHLY